MCVPWKLALIKVSAVEVSAAAAVVLCQVFLRLVRPLVCPHRVSVSPLSMELERYSQLRYYTGADAPPTRPLRLT